MTRAALLSLLLVPLSAGCSSTLDPAVRVSGLSPLGDFVTPVQSLEDRRYAGVVRQKFDFSCGSASLATLLRHQYGIAVSEPDVFRGMWTSGDRAQIKRLGFSLLDMKRYLQQRGLEANGYEVTLKQVADARTPGIALLNVEGYKHFVVVKGVSASEVLVGDPSTGLHSLPTAAFQKMWNGVYFVLEEPRRPGLFNASTQWSSYARAPLGDRFVDPLSTQALSLTAPFYREF